MGFPLRSCQHNHCLFSFRSTIKDGIFRYLHRQANFRFDHNNEHYRSKMKSILAFLLVTIACVSAETPVVLCGRQLANARVLLCYGAEYVMTVKRGPAHNMIENLSDDKEKEDMEWPWSGRRGALTANWSRYKRSGLVDECCLKPCTTDVILNYC